MSTATMIADAPPTDALRRARNAWCTARPVVLPMSLLAFGYAPLLILRGRLLMDRPHLSAFPLAVIAGGILAWKGARGLGTLEPGSQPRALAVVRLAMAMLVVAAFSAFPWLGDGGRDDDAAGRCLWDWRREVTAGGAAGVGVRRPGGAHARAVGGLADRPAAILWLPLAQGPCWISSG